MDTRMTPERRRDAELVEPLLDFLDQLNDEAFDQGDDQARADCDAAMGQLEDTLTPDGLPTEATAAALRAVIAGPIARAVDRLRLDLPLAPVSP
jgi:hypothetical protein